MKQFSFIVFLGLILSACGSDATGKNSSTSSNNKNNSSGNAKADDIQGGETIWISGLSIKKEKFKAEKCFDVPREEWMDEEPEPFCATREVELLKISLNEESVSSKINEKIASIITGQKNKTDVKAFVNSVNTTKDVQEAATEEYYCNLIDSTNRLMSISITNSWMGYVAAHPGAHTTILNFDLETGSIIGLKDILVDDYSKSLKSIVMKNFIKNYGKEGWDFTNLNTFKLSDNVSIERKGLRFSYNQYEIGPYVAGAPEVFIKWAELKDLRKENPYVKFE
jgi:hypothetical protein